MKKIYHKDKIKGGAGYWHNRWKEAATDSSCSLEYNNLIPVLDAFLPKNGRILDGGCGNGDYVTFYRTRGYKIFGLDFDTDTLKDVIQRNPALSLIAARVDNLPFKDNSFNAHISGGVLEHIESGPFEALAEIRRTLSRDGILIMTVPNKKRPFSHDRYIIKDVSDFTKDCEDRFYCYAFSKKELHNIVREAGFRIILYRDISIEYGLGKFGIVRYIMEMLSASDDMECKRNSLYREGDRAAKPQQPDIKARCRHWLKCIFVREYARVDIVQFFINILGGLFGTVHLLVCKKCESL